MTTNGVGLPARKAMTRAYKIIKPKDQMTPKSHKALIKEIMSVEKSLLIIQIVGTVILIFALVLNISGWVRLYDQNFHPDWHEEGKYIIHKKYGPYLKEVPFHQGMDLMPGQTAVAVLPLGVIPRPAEDKK